MVISLYDNMSMSNALDSGTFGGTTENASAFTPAVSGQITKLRWYRRAAGGTRVPGRLDLWDTYTQQIIASTAAPPDNGSVGWQDFTLTTPIDVQAGRPLRVALTTYNGFVAAYMASANWVASSTDLPWDATRFYQTFGSVPVYPNAGGSNAQTYLVDVVFDPGASGGAPLPTPGTIANDMVAWLADTSDNTHRDGDSVPGIPDRTLIKATNAAADAGTLVTRLDNVTSGEVATYGLRGQSIGAAVSWLLANVNTAIDLATKLHDLLSANGTGGDAYDYHGAIEDMRQKVYDIEARQLAQLQPPAPASWVSQGTQAFDTDLAWAQEADVYTITYTSLGSATINSYPSGVDVAYRVLWWAVWDGERMRDRRFADGVLPVLYDGGARMPGIVLHSTAGASGTVEAWTLS